MFSKRIQRPARPVAEATDAELKRKYQGVPTDKEMDFLVQLYKNPDRAQKFVAYALPKLPTNPTQDPDSSFQSFVRMYSAPAYGRDKVFSSRTNEDLLKEIEKNPKLAIMVAKTMLCSWLSQEESESLMKAFDRQVKEAGLPGETTPELPAVGVAQPAVAAEPASVNQEPAEDFWPADDEEEMPDSDMFDDFGMLPEEPVQDELPEENPFAAFDTETDYPEDNAEEDEDDEFERTTPWN